MQPRMAHHFSESFKTKGQSRFSGPRPETVRTMVYHLFASPYPHLVLSLSMAAILFSFFRPLGNQLFLQFWLTANVLIFLAWAMLIQRFRRLTDPTAATCTAYFRYYSFGATLAAFTMGMAGAVLFPDYFFAYQALLALILWGLASLAAGRYAASLPLAMATVLCMNLPVTMMFFGQSGDFHVLMGMVGLLFAVMSGLYAMKLNRSLHDLWALEADNRDLAAELIREISRRVKVGSSFGHADEQDKRS